MMKLSLAEDARVGALTRVVTAVTLTEAMEKSTGLQMRNFARAVKLYAEAGERASASKVVDEIRKAAEGEPWAEIVQRQCDRLLRHWEVTQGLKTPAPGGMASSSGRTRR